jgi:pyruvate/2-oxoglutarate dehydrogenase complex dihydrolipoamide dehydrogenase (E3) component
MSEEVDAVVVGLGPGGEEVAGRLLDAGLRVVGVEERLLGGECPYYGCIPSKMMIRAANLLTEGRRIPGMAGDSTVRSDWAPVAHRIRAEATDTWDDTVAVERFTAKGGQFVRGHGRLAGVGRVDVDGRSFDARRAVVLNPGTSPAIPPVPGLAETPHWTNREAIEAETVPPSLILLGGGAIGVELGQVFARFGSRVTVVEAADHLLSMEEPEAGQLIEDVFRSEGLEVRTGARAAGVRQDGDEATPSGARSCSWRPAGVPTSGIWGWSGSAWTPARGRSPWTTTCVPGSGCGRSGTWTARARSRTSRCTTRGSRWPTSWGARGLPPTTGGSAGSPSRTRRWARPG